MERPTKRIGDRLLRVLTKFTENQKRPRCYGLDEPLFPSEIHLIAVIGDNPGISVTDTARTAGVTKGAISQVSQKLVDKGFIAKTKDPKKATRVRFELTDRGRAAYYAHRLMHEQIDRELYEYLGGLKDSELATIEQFLALVEQGIDKRGET